MRNQKCLNAFYNSFGCWLDHMEVTRGQLRRLEAVFERFKKISLVIECEVSKDAKS